MPGTAQTIDLGGLERFLHGLGVPINLAPVVKGASLILQSAAKKCFDQQQDPEGSPWKPLASTTVYGRRLSKADLKAVKTSNRAPGLSRKEITALEAEIEGNRFALLRRGLTKGQAKGLARAIAENEHRRQGEQITTKTSILSVRHVQILRDTGVLMASVTTQGAGHREEVTVTDGAAALLFGTNVDYASYHQEGTKFIPIRAFLGINDDTADQIADLLGSHAERHLAA